MDGPTSLRPRSPDWRHTHTAAGTTASTYSTSLPKSAISPPHLYASLKPYASSLPPLKNLDLAKLKRLDSESNGNNEPTHLSPITGPTTSTMPSLSNPASGYPGPPPPYSSLVPASASNIPSSNPQTPSTQTVKHEPMRTADEELRDRPPSQSLPSIHEALGKDPGPFYRTNPGPAGQLAPPPPPSQQQQHQPHQQHQQPPPPSSIPHQASSLPATSPTTPIHPSYPNNSYPAHQQNVYEQHPPATPTSSSLPATRPGIDLSNRDPQFDERRRPPPEQSPAGHRIFPPPQSPHIQLQSQSQPSTPSFFPPPPPAPQAQPHSTQQYAQTYPPAYSFPPPSSYPNQPPSNGNWRGPDYPRPEDPRIGPPLPGTSFNSGRRSPVPYHHGESVKRHLETFDFELGLNEIAEASSRTLDFARKYADKAHHMHRSGIATALPSLEECDEIQNLQRSVLISMDRIRDIVVTQQHAIAEQKNREEANKARQAAYPEHGDQFAKEDDMSNINGGGGGFAGSDPKKRRGRHAPPGRCHSCARSETPEWRRGPDGARTLCNACGLHYAKLTRKYGPNVPLTGSNLRPKENDASSP